MIKLADIQCSVFPPYHGRDGQWYMSNKPQLTSLYEALTSTSQIDLIGKIRALPYKSEEQSILKRQLVACTPSSVQEGGRGEKYHARHTGLMQFDIDHLDTADMPRMFRLICQIPYVAYCGLSASGHGYWGLMPISNPERHKQHFDAMEAAFKQWGIEIDTKPRNVASLRFLAYDPDAFCNGDAKVFDKIIEPKRAASQRRLKGRTNNNAADNPWHNFNENADFDIIHDILLNAGWQHHSTKGERVRYTRPYKDVRAGLSADYHTGRRTFYLFSSEAPAARYFIDKNGGSASDVLLHYAAGGDTKLAYQILKQLNY